MAHRRGPFDPGERNRIITIEQRTATDAVGGSGTPVAAFTVLVQNMPAARKDLSGRESWQNATESARFDTRFEINYRLDMDPELIDVPKLRRLVVSGRVYNIVSASVIGQKEGIELSTIAESTVR